MQLQSNPKNDADAVAALVVGLIVVQISWKLGMRTVAEEIGLKGGAA